MMGFGEDDVTACEHAEWLILIHGSHTRISQVGMRSSGSCGAQILATFGPQLGRWAIQCQASQPSYARRQVASAATQQDGSGCMSG